MTENEMVEWHYPLNGHEFEQALGDSEGQSLVCCSPWGHKRVGRDLATKQQQQRLSRGRFQAWLSSLAVNTETTTQS